MNPRLILTILALAVGLAAPAFAQPGGTLRWVEAQDDSLGYALDSASSRLTQSRSATVPIGDGPARSVKMYEPFRNSVLRLVIPQQNSDHLVYCDADGDDHLTEDECYRMTGESWMRENDDVRACLPIGDSTHVLHLAVSGNDWMMSIQRARGGFLGDLELPSGTYPARYVPRELCSHGDASAVDRIVVDTNDDGLFALDEDLWFSARGFACLEGRTWSVETRIASETAKVVLAPWDGPVGTLVLAGSGIDTLHLSVAPSQLSQWLPKLPLCLTQGGAWLVPPGRYTFDRVVLATGDPPVQYTCTPSGRNNPAVAVTEAATSTFQAGGPLEIRFNVWPRPLTRNVVIDCPAVFNEAGLEFDLDVAQAMESPKIEVVNGAGVVVGSGEVEYG